MNDLTTELAGEEVRLLPERAIFWPAQQTLFVADPHIGKVASMRAAGAPIPGGSTTADLRRLSELVDRTGAGRLVVLGDLYHARAGRLAVPTASAFKRWRDHHGQLEVALVPGNHDTAAGLPVIDLDIDVLEPGHRMGPFCLHHEPTDAREGYVLAGHVHPGVNLRGPGREHVRVPCFWVRPRHAVLPAFGGTTGLAIADVEPDDTVFAVADDEVVEV